MGGILVGQALTQRRARKPRSRISNPLQSVPRDSGLTTSVTCDAPLPATCCQSSAGILIQYHVRGNSIN